MAEIKTKFNIGDKVFYQGYDFDLEKVTEEILNGGDLEECFNHECHEDIVETEVESINIDKMGAIKYHFENGRDFLEDGPLFGTENEIKAYFLNKAKKNLEDQMKVLKSMILLTNTKHLNLK